MKRHISIFLFVGLMVSAAHGQLITNATPKDDGSSLFKNDREKFSYALGMYWANGAKAQMKRLDIDYDPAAVEKAFNDIITGSATTITEAQQKEVLNELNKLLSAKRDEKRKEQQAEIRAKGEKNLVDSPAFMEKNKSEPGVITLPSGVQYKVIKEGNGSVPGPQDDVTMEVIGKLIDGTEFENTAKRGRPMNSRVGTIPIKGWSEAVQLMKSGAKWEIFVPPSLGYGTNIVNPMVPPNSVLVYDVTLLSIRTNNPASAAEQHAVPAVAPLTSDIIKVPSKAEMDKGAKIETIKQEDLDKEKAKAAAAANP